MFRRLFILAAVVSLGLPAVRAQEGAASHAAVIQADTLPALLERLERDPEDIDLLVEICSQYTMRSEFAAIHPYVSRLRRAGAAPLFAVRDDVIYAAPLDDVEWTLVAEAARRAGIRWVERPVGAAQLRLFDELFSFDCEGVSSIASFEGTPYLSLTAERIAAALAALPER